MSRIINKLTYRSAMLYFAYGSNLSTVRLSKRIPSAKLITTGKLTQHRLLFHKVSCDGSAKCDACYTGHEHDCVYGALYRIDPAQKKYLDQVEGLGNGYLIKQVVIFTSTGGSIEAFTYYATHTDPTLKPFHWYKAHVLHGARFHCFPDQYVRAIEAISSIDDEDRTRNERELQTHP